MNLGKICGTLDLVSRCDAMIPTQKTGKIKAQEIERPASHYYEIAEIYDFSLKNKMSIPSWIINTDEMGVIELQVFNYGEKPLVICRGDRFAQLICKEYPIPMEIG